MIKVESLVNLSEYPINDPQSAQYNEVVKFVQSELYRDGCSVLSTFLTNKGLDLIAQEAEQRKDKAFYSDSKLCNVYLAKGNSKEPKDHPQNIFMERSNGFITADLLSEGTLSYLLYHWKPLRSFLAQCLSKKELYIYEDPVSNMIVNVCKPGQTFNWHFDTNEFTITYLLKAAESGGYFEYVPNLRLKNDECFKEVKKVLDGDRTRVKRLKLCSGDLQFFLGRYSLHRVTHNNGNSDRLLLIQSFTETPGIVGSKERVKDLYGKTTQAHNNIFGKQNRNDDLLD
ncbi:MAG: hypothetical protein QGF84_05535 [Candidatus Thioglobus sp.]|jgi:hypothetical protein|nr:hypothetical protein [Candidatus Thioglobus sp.]